MSPEEKRHSPLPFNDPPKSFANSAPWRALCEAVDAPDVVQICQASSADIISPVELEILEKAFASTNVSSDFSAELDNNDLVTSTVAHHQRMSIYFYLHHSCNYNLLIQDLVRAVKRT